jgi:hypothetical protein
MDFYSIHDFESVVVYVTHMNEWRISIICTRGVVFWCKIYFLKLVRQ